MKRKIVTLLTACLVLFGSLTIPMDTQAVEPYNNFVFGSDGAVYGPSVQTNQYSGCIFGGCVLSSKEQLIKDMGGFTDIEYRNGAEPVLYIGDYFGDSDERTLATKTATDLGGGLVCMLDLQLFKYTGTWNQPIYEVANPLEIIIGLPDEANGTELWDNASKWDFAVVRIHDGKADILKDSDKDPATLTFQTNKFSYYGVIYAPKGNIDTYLAQQTSQSTTSGSSSNDELDKVPKMGDSFFDSFITFGKGRRR